MWPYISTNNYPNDPLLIGFTILKSCISGTWNIEHTICRRQRTSTANSIRADPGYLCLNKLKLCQIKLAIPHVPNVTLTQITSLKKQRNQPLRLFLSVSVSSAIQNFLFLNQLYLSLPYTFSFVFYKAQNYATECPIYGISFVSTTVKNIL